MGRCGKFAYFACFIKGFGILSTLVWCQIFAQSRVDSLIPVVVPSPSGNNVGTSASSVSIPHLKSTEAQSSPAQLHGGQTALGNASDSKKGASSQSVSFAIFDNPRLYIRYAHRPNKRVYLFNEKLLCSGNTGKQRMYSFWGDAGQSFLVTEVTQHNCKDVEQPLFAIVQDSVPKLVWIKKNLVTTSSVVREWDERCRLEYRGVLREIKKLPRIYALPNLLPKKEIFLIEYYDNSVDYNIKHVIFVSIDKNVFLLTNLCTTDLYVFNLDNKAYIGFEQGECNSELYLQEIFQIKDDGVVSVFSDEIS